MHKQALLFLLTVGLLLGTLLPPERTPARAQSQPEAEPVTITLGTSGFTPASVTVEIGQQVRWINATQVAKTLKFGTPVPAPTGSKLYLPLVMVYKAAGLQAADAPADVVLTPNGLPYIQVFDTAGTYPFFLAEDSSIRGEVIVKRASTPTPTDGTSTATPTTPTTTPTTPTTTPTTTPGSRPRVLSSTPADGATNTARDGYIAVSVALSGGTPLDSATLTAATVKLTRASDGAQVAATIALGSGGLILLQPSVLLDATTQYNLALSDGIKDTSGLALEPFSMRFTTGASGGGAASGAYFEKITLPTASGPNGRTFSVLALGPDGRLYAGTQQGEILRYSIASDGTLSTPQLLTSLQTYTGGAAKPRLLLGMAFDPAASPSSPVLWVSHSAPSTGAADWSGKLSKLSGASLESVQDVIVDLPRSSSDRASAGLAFKPGSANLLYISQNSNSELGAPGADARPERRLSAAILQLDISKLPTTLPLSVKTDEGGTYNPGAGNAALTVYASGVRDAYDLAWHSNGQLYVPNQGTQSGGATPATPNPLPAACTKRIDGKAYNKAKVPGITVTTALNDYLFRIDPASATKGYYGQPNPTRCEWVVDGGNPTADADVAEVGQYPVNTKADSNWRGFAYQFGTSKLPEGLLEYQSGLFGGKLQGRLLVARAGSDDDIVALTPGGNNQDIASAESGIAGFTGLDDPIDLVENPANGFIYVAEASRTAGQPKLTLLRPLIARGAQEPSIKLSATRLIFNDVAGDATASAAQALTIQNTGGGPLTVSKITFSGPAKGDFVVSLPSQPLVVPANSAVTVSVSLKAQATGLRTATLQVRSDDPKALLTTVELRGLGAKGIGGSGEPLLQQVVDTLGYPINVGDDNLDNLKLPPYGLIGDEVPLQRMQKAGDGPVTIEPVAVFAPAKNGETLRFGWYSQGNSASPQELFSISAAYSQTLSPQAVGSLSFDPGSATFGLYSQWAYFNNRRVYSEDFLNSWDTFLHHVRAYPLKGSDGVAVPNTYLLATEETFVTKDSNSSDTQDIVAIVRNVRPASGAAACSGCAVKAENQTWIDQSLGAGPFPFADHMAFSTMANPTPKDKNKNGIIGNGDDGPDAQSHDRNTLRLSNTGSTPLIVSNLYIRGPWVLTNEPAMPLTLQPNSSLALEVRFTAIGNGFNPAAYQGGVHKGSLVIESNDPAKPTTTISLAGYWMPATEDDEPTVEQLAQVFGYTTSIPDKRRLGPEYAAKGEEVLSSYWERVDTSKPVLVRQLAAYHGCCTPEAYIKLSSSTTTLKHDNVDSQSIMPRISGGSGPAQKTFTPKGKFSINIEGYSTFMDPSDQNKVPVGVRTWIARDESGAIIPNTYIVGQDYAGSDMSPPISSTVNFDYQDNVYVISNIRPNGSSSQLGKLLALIDTGNSSGTSYTLNGRTWSSDKGLYKATNAQGQTVSAPDEGPFNFEINGTNDDKAYQTYRGKVGVGGAITYTIPIAQIKPGVTAVTVKLDFAEMYWGRPGGGVGANGQRIFDVYAEGDLVVENFDIYQAAQGALNAIQVPIDRVELGPDGNLTLRFVCKTDNVSINAIEIYEAQ